MICLRCGYCCKFLSVVVIKDPQKGICEDNFFFHEGRGESCLHLKGDKPGEYSCALHDEPWYDETPCFSHTQFEIGNKICRVGEYQMKLVR